MTKPDSSIENFVWCINSFNSWVKNKQKQSHRIISRTLQKLICKILSPKREKKKQRLMKVNCFVWLINSFSILMKQFDTWTHPSRLYPSIQTTRHTIYTLQIILNTPKSDMSESGECTPSKKQKNQRDALIKRVSIERSTVLTLWQKKMTLQKKSWVFFPLLKFPLFKIQR